MTQLDEETDIMESIFPDEFSRSDNEVTIRVDLDEDCVSKSVVLKAQVPDDYPDSTPILSLSEEYPSILESLKRTAEENIGVQMLFTLTSTLKELLIEHYTNIQKEQNDAITRQKEAQEREEMKKFTGTKVTPASFLQWQSGFTDDFLSRSKQTAVAGLTGRQMFEGDETLRVSDTNVEEVS